MNINSLLDIAAFSPKFVQFPKDKISHLSFAAWVIREVSPKIFVEFGTHYGNSYFAFCQSVAEASLLTECYSIYTSQASEHSGQYNDENFAALNEHNEKHYSNFSRLLPMTIDEAISCFSDKSIELLNIDGLHTYEAVFQGFEMWLPKLAPGAVVMFQDTNVLEPNFGVWKLWGELQTRYPNNLKFEHSNGMGVFQLNDAPTDKFMAWVKPDATEKQRLASYFAILDSRLKERYELELLKIQVVERDGQIASLTETVADRDLALAERDQAVAEDDGQIVALSQIINKLDKEIKRITQSKSWKLTRPLRFFRRKLEGSSKNSGDSYNLSFQYSNDSVQRSDLPVASAQKFQQNTEYVSLFKGKPLNKKPVKLICFYQPQFQHDEGCSDVNAEWTNVKSAKPQFIGHYQPHVPGELGYYNLLNPGIQRRQIELANLYGIDGFCFYFYWYGGKRILEAPIQNFLKDTSLDFPYCLCWLNENLSRQANITKSDILIAQQHSPEDDIAFIQYVSQYMCDPRYIRIDNKPLLLVYCPSLLPSAKETAGRWRQWCRDKGFGEIYLAYTQSLETVVDPSIYGFDAAIELPPYNILPKNITDQVQTEKHGLSCNVYDWNKFVEGSCNYKKPKYALFRGVNPSWDNTALLENNSMTFLNSLPRGYQEWLFNAIAETVERFSNPGQRLIFINAWNEWEKAAYLEPDQRYGYAYLEATRMALVRRSVIENLQAPDNNHSIAVVIHAFYEDVFDEILGYLEKIHSISLNLYVTTPIGLLEHTQKKLQRQQHSFYVLPVSNRGRDILPFIKVMPEVLKEGHDMLIKIHTKKSTHRVDGDLWRKDVFEKLLTDQAIMANINHLYKNPEIGILGPNDHNVPMNLYMGSNADRVKQYAARMGVDADGLEKLNFVAGSMFIARSKAFLPLMNIAFTETDFEAEAKQVDGTLAHAFERLFSVSAIATRLITSCPDNIISEDYRFRYKKQAQ